MRPLLRFLASNLRLAALVLTVTGLLVLSDRQAGATRLVNDGVPVSEVKNTQSLEGQGYKLYAGRPPGVQAIMRRMYTSDSHYRAFSALVIDNAPGDSPNSLRVQVQQPGVVRTSWYPNADGSGPPVEATSPQGARQLVYLAPDNAYTMVNRDMSEPAPPPLSEAPVGVTQAQATGTQIPDLLGTAPALANMLIHPTFLMTTEFFESKDVSLAGTTSEDGRTVWILNGRQVPTISAVSGLRDSWRMFVDDKTGLVLRLDYYSGSGLIGQVKMDDVTIDGVGTGDRGSPPMLALPANATAVGVPQYEQLAGKHQRG